MPQPYPARAGPQSLQHVHQPLILLPLIFPPWRSPPTRPCLVFFPIFWSLQDPTQRALLLWPVKQLDFSRRYVVAMRGLVDGDRNPIAPSDAFRAFRDGIPTDDPDIETRRDIYAVRTKDDAQNGLGHTSTDGRGT